MISARPITADEREAAGQRLGHGHQVGRHAPLLAGQPGAGAAGAGLHLVGDEHDAVLVAQRARRLGKFRRRHVEAAFALHRLQDDGRHALAARRRPGTAAPPASIRVGRPTRPCGRARGRPACQMPGAGRGRSSALYRAPPCRSAPCPVSVRPWKPPPKAITPGAARWRRGRIFDGVLHRLGAGGDRRQAFSPESRRRRAFDQLLGTAPA